MSLLFQEERHGPGLHGDRPLLEVAARVLPLHGTGAGEGETQESQFPGNA
jgi:hypothetical protein